MFILQMMDGGGRDYRHWQRPCESGSRYCEKKAPHRLDLCVFEGTRQGLLQNRDFNSGFIRVYVGAS